MAEAKRAAGSLAKQPNETELQYVQRYYAMPDASRELASRLEHLRHNRKLVNKVIRNFGWESSTVAAIYGDVLPTLGEIIARWTEAHDQAYDRWVEEVANTPIDDAAWEEELERRAEIENPEIERVNITTRYSMTRPSVPARDCIQQSRVLL
jgi:hypothetical protein